MNSIRRFLGLVWILLGPAAIYYLVSTAIREISLKPSVETKVQWFVFIGISLPIAAGFILFGYYALRGEYDRDRA